MASVVAGLWKRAAELSKEQWAIILAAIVALNYAAIYLIYFRFYAAFGLRPSDVGLSRLRLLQESILGPLLLPVTIVDRNQLRVGVFLGLVIVARVVWWATAEHHAKPNFEAAAKELGATVGVAIVALALVLLTHSYLELNREAIALGKSVRGNGKIVVSWVNIQNNRPVLDVQAAPVDVTIKDDAPAPALTDGCVLYLGQTDEQAVLFDVRRELVARVAVGDVSVVTHANSRNYPDERLPERCSSDDGNVVAE